MLSFLIQVVIFLSLVMANDFQMYPRNFDHYFGVLWIPFKFSALSDSYLLHVFYVFYGFLYLMSYVLV